MTTLLIILQIFIISLLVLVILLQKTSADGLSGLSGGGSGVMSGRGVSNFFTKLTAILAAAFMLNSLALAKIESNKALQGKGLLDKVVNSSTITPDSSTKQETLPVVPDAGAGSELELLEDEIPEVPAAG